MATIQELRSWIERDITRFGRSAHFVEFVITAASEFKCRIYTDVHQFTIVARAGVVRVGHLTEGAGYLGCTANCRKPRAGEAWTRGSDLADGPLLEATWHRILGDIVSYEMVRVHLPKGQAHEHVWRDTGGESTGAGHVHRSECECGAKRVTEVTEPEVALATEAG